MKTFNQMTLMGLLVIFLGGITLVKSVYIQPREKHNETKSSDGQLPPEVFPKVDSNNPISHVLQGELPPDIFPDDKALEKSHADLVAKVTSKNDLNNKNNTKDTMNDDKTDKTSVNKTVKVASEVPDLLNTSFMNITTYDDGPENPINNDTEIVNGPHVVNNNKTHDEDGSTIKENCSANETTEENNSTVKNECSDNPTVTKNETIKAINLNDKNDSATSKSIEMTTEIEMKENSTVNTTTEDVIETTTNLNNVTNNQEYENVTDILEPKSIENDTSTMEYNTTIPTTENSIAVNATKDDNVTVNITKNDNVTIVEQSTSEENVDKSTPPSTTVITKQTSTNSTVTELPSAKVETTSVNISENIIDHKAGSPVALATSQQHGDHSHATSGKSSAFLQPTESAAILAGVFVGIALLGYVGLLVWRRILEKRYGNREMLVNEDDFYDTNDLRNFEL